MRGRGLEHSPWGQGAAAELALLEKDARLRGYHGFVRLGTLREEVATVRLRGHPDVGALGVELISSEVFDPFPVVWEAYPAGARPEDGPLSVADDLPFPPFELTILLPEEWPDELHRHAVSSVLVRFIQRYRAIHAYGLNL